MSRVLHTCGREERPPQRDVAIMLGRPLQDEMKALQWINSLLLLSGYLGFLATWILDQLYVVTHKAGLATANRITQRVLRTLFPHFNLARQGASPYTLSPLLSPQTDPALLTVHRTPSLSHPRDVLRLLFNCAVQRLVPGGVDCAGPGRRQKSPSTCFCHVIRAAWNSGVECSSVPWLATGLVGVGLAVNTFSFLQGYV